MFDVFLQYYTFISVLYIAVIVAIAHLVTPKEYHWKSNTISDLAAQGYDRKWIMQLGLVGFGLLLGFGSAAQMFQLQADWFNEIPLLVYAGLVAASGTFCTRPFVRTEEYSERDDRLHSLFAQTGGVFFTAAILLKSLVAETLVSAAPHILFLVLVSMTALFYGRAESSMKGIVQRILWVVSFIWLTFLA
ncbi:MAG: DUF998 domain-containing protein [Candidatus Thorarchaeota archaeon]